MGVEFASNANPSDRELLDEIHAVKVYAILCGVPASSLIPDDQALHSARLDPNYLTHWRNHLKFGKEARG